MTQIDPVQFGILIGKLDAVLAKIDEHIADDKKVHSDVERRVNALEHDGTKAKTVAGIFGTVGGALAAFAFKYLLGQPAA